MERKFIFNYDALNNYLIENQKDPNWTDGELTMLRNNCKNNLSEILSNPKEYIIVINELTGDISINGHSGLEDKFYMIPTGYEMSKKDHLYHQIKLSLEEAENRGIYDEIFKEIKE